MRAPTMAVFSSVVGDYQAGRKLHGKSYRQLLLTCTHPVPTSGVPGLPCGPPARSQPSLGTGEGSLSRTRRGQIIGG